jgi:putative heme-binding domain-containing protein
MCFDPLGNLYTADCHSRPVTMLLRGGYYQSFGKPHDGLGFAPEICGHDHGSTGLCGIVYYAADHFPKVYHDTIFVGNCVTSRICHDRLEWTGSTPKCVLQPDFMTSDDPWFRPVDIKLGPDGALYVADFYNRIIGHYEVPLTHPGRDRERGRIWRIVYKGTDGKAKPAKAPRKDFSAAKAEELIEDLGHANLTVRMLAMNQLVARQAASPDMALAALVKETMTKSTKPVQVIHCMWAAARGATDATLLRDTGEELWTGSELAGHSAAGLMHRLRILAHLGVDSEKLKEEHVTIMRAPVTRIAAETIGTHPSPRHVRSLVQLFGLAGEEDTVLRHAIRIALRNHLRRDESWQALDMKAMTVNQHMIIADVALAVPTPKAAEFLVSHLKSTGQSRDTQVRQIARYGSDKSREELLNLLKPTLQPALVRAFHQGCQERGSGWNEDCQNWATGVVKQLLATEKPEQLTAAAELCGLLKLKDYAEPLTGFARKASYPDPVRVAACYALAAIDAKANIGLLGGILSDPSERFGVQERCIQLLAGVNQPEANAELVKALTVASARLQSAIAHGLAGSPRGAEKLFEAVAAGKASARLLQEPGVQARLKGTRLAKLDERLAELTKGLPPADQKLNELLTKRRTGFASAKPQVNAGMLVYEKNCANCHQLAGKGAKVGPQLDGIGIRGVDRLLEDLIDPNRNIDQAFRASTILLKNGQLVSGLPLREEGQVLVIADGQGKEIRVPKGEIEERKVSPLSPMPANLIDQIPEEEFYHLLAYLLEQRGK